MAWFLNLRSSSAHQNNRRAEARVEIPFRRRAFVRALAVGIVAVFGSSAGAADDVVFFVTADPQINIPRWGTAGTEEMIEIMNRAPDEEFPFGGKVGEPRGVLVAGDLVDDLKNPENWKLYQKLFHPRGAARMRFPTYEGIGNHDLDSRLPSSAMSVIEKDFVARNRQRLGDLSFCEEGYHYSWDWGPLHLVNLNAFPGNAPRPVYDREAPWNNPRESLRFLERDLRERVGVSGRPVILMWHYGLRGWGLEKWWKHDDLRALEEVIAPYNVVLILHGHEHAYRRYRWQGYDVLMAPSPQRDRDPKKPETKSTPKGFVVVRLRGDELQIAERSADGWRDSWSRQIDLGRPASPAPQRQRELPQMLSIARGAAPPLPQGMQDNDGGVIDGQLVMVGGFCHGTDDDWKPGKYPRGFLKKGWALDIEDPSRGWRAIPDFPGAARQEMFAATVGNEIYFWGGFSYTEPFSYRDGFKLSRRDGAWTWTALPDLPRAAAAGNAVAIGSRIYLFGGMDYDAKAYHVSTDRTGKIDRFGARLYVFDTAAERPAWRELSECPGTPRMMTGLAALEGQLYVVGGYGVDRKSVDRKGRAYCVVDNWRFDPASSTWTRLRDLPVAVAGFGSGSIVYRDRYLLLPTGYPYPEILNPDETARPRYGRPSRIDRSSWKQHPRLAGTTYENHVWVYDTDTDLFGTATPLPYDDHGPATHVIGDTAYLFPGETAGFWWKGEYFGHAPEFVLRGEISLLDWQAGRDRVELDDVWLIDDRDVLYRSGTQRVFHEARRWRDRPIIAAGKPWERGTVAYCSVHRDERSGNYQLWYQAWTPQHGCYLAYATSTNGREWRKPELGLLEFEGSTKNNLVFKVGYGAGVIFDPHDKDAKRRYKLAYWDRYGTCVAFSPDGIHWDEYEKNPVIRGSHGEYAQPRLRDEPDDGRNGPPLSTSDVTDPIWDPARKAFVIYAKTWLDGPDGTMHWKRAVVRTESRDFVSWSKPQLVLWPDEHDHAGESKGTRGDDLARTTGGGGSGGVQLHSGPTFYRRGRYLSLLQVMDPGETGNMPIELAVSHDGLRFERPARGKWLIPPLDDKSRFDASLIWSNATPIEVDDEIRFYYGGYGKPWNSNDSRQISGVGLATLRLDRFAGLRPIGRIGQITLRARDLSAARAIRVNADARGENASVRVEVLDENGYRLRGFTMDDAEPIRGDVLRAPARFRERSLAELPQGKYRLRVHLENAEVFSLSLRGYVR